MSDVEFYYDVAAVVLHDYMEQGRHFSKNRVKSAPFFNAIKMSSSKYYKSRNELLLEEMRDSKPINIVEIMELDRLRGYDNLKDCRDLEMWGVSFPEIVTIYQYAFAEKLMMQEKMVLSQTICHNNLEEWLNYLNPDKDSIKGAKLTKIKDNAHYDAEIFQRKQKSRNFPETLVI